ncbi:(2Fe-2S)-binding protein [Sulfurisphaera ohwakuensis]|uniref:(2Fe-2S)-binding protein n=1 Tax=Sulfurisphaera ohwakuensis TaxID=69656 RepID=UPI0036F1D3B4
MEISTIISKRKRRVIGISYYEEGLPHVEVNLNGKKINLANNFYRETSRIRIPFNIALFHRNPIIRKLSPKLSLFQKLPTKYFPSTSKSIEKVTVKRIIIGGGTAGITALDDKSLLITHELIGDLEYDYSPIPEIEREDLLEKIKEKIKKFHDRIIIGKFLGKFDEGLLFETKDKYLLLTAEDIIISVGGRTLRPIFNRNYIVGIVSRELYLRKLKNKYKNVVVLGFTNLTARTALNAEKAIIIYPRGIKPLFSKFYREQLEEKGIEIIEDNISDIKNKKDVIVISTYNGNLVKAQLVVFSIVKQPRIEIITNLGVDYRFNHTLHIYQPADSSKVIGGALGIMDEYISYLSATNTLDYKKVSIYEPGLFNNDVIQNNSPYLYGEGGIICECEDIDLNDVNFAKKLGFISVEDIKRITGLGTGHCQGKVCSIVAGSILKSPTLITFRSPIYPVSL